MTEGVSLPTPGVEGDEPIPGEDADAIEQLAHLIPAMWRTLKRASRASAALPANESQVTILRMLALHGDLTPAQLAEELHVSRPTVSNLLRDLVAADLVMRTISPHDARSSVISATAQGRSVLEAFRQDRAEVLRGALRQLSDEEQAEITDVARWLRHMLRQLEQFVERDADVGLEGAAS